MMGLWSFIRLIIIWMKMKVSFLHPDEGVDILDEET